MAVVGSAISLGAVAAKLTQLDVACSRCPRAGRVSTARLLAEHGPALPIPELRRIVAADCPRWTATGVHDGCGVHFPGLSAVF